MSLLGVGGKFSTLASSPALVPALRRARQCVVPLPASPPSSLPTRPPSTPGLPALTRWEAVGTWPGPAGPARLLSLTASRQDFQLRHFPQTSPCLVSLHRESGARGEAMSSRPPCSPCMYLFNYS